MATYKRGSGNYKSSFMTIITKIATETINSTTTIQDDDELKKVLKANTRYTGLLLLLIDASSVPDLDITFKVISGTVYARFGYVSGLQPATAFGVESGLQTSGADQFVSVLFAVKTGSGGGTLQFQWAQNVSDAAGTAIKEGSMMILYEE